MAMADEFTLSGIFMGVALCIITHGIFISTGFEGMMHEAFAPAASGLEASGGALPSEPPPSFSSFGPHAGHSH